MVEKTGGKKRWILLGVFAAFFVICVIIALFTVSRNNKLKATTMRLLRRVNVVTLEDANGKEKAMTDNMKLQNGNALKTEADSMVSVGLDDYKVVTVEENSRAEFYQSGKQLELNLTQGSLFIDVSQHLADDESFDVRTSTMTAGIRGTTIYVSQNPDGTWTMYLVSGALHVHGQNPNTGEEKEVDIVGGQKVTAITFDDRETDTIILRVEEFTEDEMPLQLINELAMNENALNRAGSESGFDTDYILELANGFKSSNENTNAETVETETTTETETESETSLEEEGEGDEEGENSEEENPEENAEEEEELTDQDTNDDDEDVSDNGDAVSDLTDGESESSEETEEGFKLSDYLDYIDENGIWHLKDGTLFDPAFYREMYGDTLAEEGFLTDEDLLRHYLEYGKDENRFPTQESYDAFVEAYQEAELQKLIKENEEREQAAQNVQEETTRETRTYHYTISYYVNYYNSTNSLSDPNYINNFEAFSYELPNGNPNKSGEISSVITKNAAGEIISRSYSPSSIQESLRVDYNADNTPTYERTEATLTYNINVASIINGASEDQLTSQDGYSYTSESKRPDGTTSEMYFYLVFNVTMEQ